MRHQYLCIAAILASALLSDAVLNGTEAGRAPTRTTSASPILVINMRSYNWKLPEFRMAGDEAYVVVQVQNTHDYPMEMSVSCRSAAGRIPEMSGYHTIGPREFLHMDTRKYRSSGRGDDGMRVKCRFRSNSSAKVEAWVYDQKAQKAKAGAGNTSLING